MDIEKNINNEFDYSNIIPTSQYIGMLVKYCEKINNHYLQLINQDEERNEKLKPEYREYQYGKMYGTEFSIVIYDNNFKYIECETFQAYEEAVQNKQVNNIDSLKINLDINFKRGTTDKIKEHTNELTISFKPYEIKFTRKSNFDDSMMNQVEKNINELFKSFPTINTIFCTKE